MYFPIPTSLFILSLFFLPLATAQTSQGPPLTPPSTFGTATSGSTSTSGSASSNASTSATTTSSAQYPSLSGYPSCVTQCLSVAIASANCSSIVDVNCFCESGRTNFEQGIVNCVATQCPTQLSSAENLSQQFCNVANTSVTLSFPSAPPITSSSSSSSSSSVTSTSPSTSTGASGSPSASGNAAANAYQGVGTSLLASLAASAVAMAFGVFCI